MKSLQPGHCWPCLSCSDRLGEQFGGNSLRYSPWRRRLPAEPSRHGQWVCRKGQGALGHVVCPCRRPAVPACLLARPLTKRSILVPGVPQLPADSHSLVAERQLGVVVIQGTRGCSVASPASFDWDATHVLVSAKPLTGRETHASQTVGIKPEEQVDGGHEEG